MPQMIILVGGLPGSGLTDLTQNLADALGFYHYPNLAKFRATLPPQVMWNSLSDEYLEYVVQKETESFPLLSKMYSHMIIPSTMHRSRPRALLFERVKRLGPASIVWIESDDEYAQDFLDSLGVGEEQVHKRLQLRAENKKEFQPIAEPHIVFENTGNIEDASARLYELVRAHIAASA